MIKYTFEDLLSEKEGKDFDKIIIPKIQRDYVQGSGSYDLNDNVLLNSKGQRFLDAIFDYLKENNGKEFVLDFIYGSIKNKCFYPLDGQQRLTTLYLLYWYTAFKEVYTTNRYVAFLSRFTYETRTTSTDFCKLLNDADPIRDYEGKPSTYIRNLTKYHKAYDLDPTIRAMLTMLDAIDKKYRECDDSFRLAIGLKKIKFYLLPLNEFNLDEELYVKMNARGKVLTDYENFKADFISWMKSEHNPFINDMIDEGDNHRKRYIDIASSLDNAWSDIVFKNHKEDFDLAFFKMIVRWFLSYYFANTEFPPRSDNDFQNNVLLKEFSSFIENMSNENIYNKFDCFKIILERNIEVLNSFTRFMDNCSSNSFIFDSIKPSWDIDKPFDLASTDKTTQRDLAIFLGISLYLNKVEQVDEDIFKKWVRFVYNVSEGTDINSWETFLPVVKAFNKISEITFDLDDYFAHIDTSTSSSQIKAVKMEEIKSSYIRNDETWRDLFIQGEKQQFLRNDLNVMISEGMDIDTFTNRLNNLELVFDKDGLNQSFIEGDNHFIMRGIIANLTSNGLVNKKLFDTNDKEEQLKKTLEVECEFTSIVRSYLDVDNRQTLIDMINNSVNQLSSVSISNEPILTSKLQEAHNSLYRIKELYDYLAKKDENLVHIVLDDNHFYARFASRGKRNRVVLLDSNRDQLFERIISREFVTSNDVITSPNKKWYIGRDIEFNGHSSLLDKDVVIVFIQDGSMKIKNTDDTEIATLQTNYFNSTYDEIEQEINALLFS